MAHTHTSLSGSFYDKAITGAVAAGDATEEQVIFVAPDDCVIQGFSITPDSAVSGDDTDRKNLNFINKGSDGSGTTELANLDLETDTDLSAAVETEITATGTAIASRRLSQGDVVVLEIEQVASGVALPRMLVESEYRWDDGV